MSALNLVGWIVLCEATGMIGGFATARGVRDWYPSLRKPSFNPPSSVFAPVWTILYLLMGIAAALVYSAGSFGTPISLFLVQLGLNLLWSFLFFKFRNPRAALVNLLLLDLSIIATIVAFYSVKPLAAGLLVPYLLWCLFATALNEEIVRLNPKGSNS